MHVSDNAKPELIKREYFPGKDQSDSGVALSS